MIYSPFSLRLPGAGFFLSPPRPDGSAALASSIDNFGETVLIVWPDFDNTAGCEPESVRMADIFISYTSSDREWAYWLAKKLEALGHTPRIHEYAAYGRAPPAPWQASTPSPDRCLCN